MEDDHNCNTRLRLGLGLGLGLDEDEPKLHKKQKINKSEVHLDLSFTLWRGEETIRDMDHHKLEGSCSEDQYPNNNNSKGCDSTLDSGRKKLRLTKEQFGLLEHSFKIQNTLNQAEKEALAEQLNLKPRQVEVWFQNRRARTKLKQTEVDCEFLKKCCEALRDENRRLLKELQELRSPKLGKSSSMVVICPSCEQNRCKKWL
ncbi:hypothetical protein Tsubulata_031163 [Turnera subulata]|uniref:Homeobox domain-containing protein n=1 Tax=Turnera subulata TaxID=218843 RepID=A0A9Q0FG13_9ROSI|nr:hypothetical protein Tsubulata_031163 [Turnera subulata]